jgi:hypothetical protein
MKQASGSNWYKVPRKDVRQTSLAQIHFFAVVIPNSLFSAAAGEPKPQLSCGVNRKFAR